MRQRSAASCVSARAQSLGQSGLVGVCERVVVVVLPTCLKLILVAEKDRWSIYRRPHDQILRLMCRDVRH